VILVASSLPDTRFQKGTFFRFFHLIDLCLGIPAWFITKYRWNRRTGHSRKESVRKALWHLGLKL
jgi:hypothetical protein